MGTPLIENSTFLRKECQVSWVMASHSHFKLRFSKKSLDRIRGFLFQFGLILGVWLALVIM